MSDEAIPPVDRSARCTTSGEPWTEESRSLKPNGQQKDYVILCEEEREKGFVRPVRSTYRHVGVRPSHPLRDLTPEEAERYAKYGYAKYEAYPEGGEGSVVGRFWTEQQLAGGCGVTTSMGRALAETYARDPEFYGATFCCGCGRHLRVEEFVWLDGSRVGS